MQFFRAFGKAKRRQKQKRKRRKKRQYSPHAPRAKPIQPKITYKSFFIFTLIPPVVFSLFSIRSHGKPPSQDGKTAFWPGKTHDFPDFLPHDRFVAMYLTVGTEGFRLHKRTLVASHPGIGFQICTFGTKSAFGVVFFAAVQGNHFRYHPLFPFPLIGCTFHQLILRVPPNRRYQRCAW